MNILGLVFSLMLIFSYGFYACWDKQSAAARLQSTYVHYQKANRAILNLFYSEVYSNLEGKPIKGPKSHTQAKKKQSSKPAPKKFNQECAKINLWPLIQEGREAHPLLYEKAAHMIAVFYGSFSPDKRFANSFLDALLASAKIGLENKDSFALEKLVVEDYQHFYYKMLKGTKNWDLRLEKGYPSLLDYMKVEPSNSKLCLFHADVSLLTVLFNPQVADRLYAEMHKKGGPVPTMELVQRICNELRLLSLDSDLFALLEFGRPRHDGQKKLFIAEEKDVSLRRNLYVKG